MTAVRYWLKVKKRVIKETRGIGFEVNAKDCGKDNNKENRFFSR
jgi:hypothetical protein